LLLVNDVQNILQLIKIHTQEGDNFFIDESVQLLFMKKIVKLIDP